METPAAAGLVRQPVARTNDRHMLRHRLASAWAAVSAAVGVALGVAPHVLHHVGLIAGAAFLTGLGGNLLFFGAGLVLSIPLLRRLHARFSTWWAPTIGIATFALMFSVSVFVIGPALAPDGSPPEAPATPARSVGDHAGHHGR